MKEALLAAAAAAAMIGLSGRSLAAETPATQEVVVQCTTAGNGLDGARKACDSEVTTIRAPKDHVLVLNSHSYSVPSGNGSEQECRYGFGDYVEVIPGTGIMQPTSFWARAHARSPSGHSGRRGWLICKHAVKTVAYRPRT